MWHTVDVMSKLRYFFYGYRKHYLVWVAFFAVGEAIRVGVLNVGGVYAALANIVIVAPIFAFITLGIYKVLRKIFGSKDFM